MNRFNLKYGMLALVVLLSVSQLFAEPTSIDVYFSPRGGCEDAIIAEISKAERSICVQAYYFTNSSIAEALLEAHKRGAAVEVILDKSQRGVESSSATFFLNHGIPVLIDNAHAIAHNKIVLIDDTIITTGSFNLTKAAEASNAENVLVLREFAEIAKKYRENYYLHRAHSKPYVLPKSAHAEDKKAEDAATTRNIEQVVYITRTGKRHHTASCRYARISGRKVSLAKAERMGLTHCKVCKP